MSKNFFIGIMLFSYLTRIAQYAAIPVLLITGLYFCFRPAPDRSPDWRGGYAYEEAGGVGKVTVNVYGNSKSELRALVQVENGSASSVFRCTVKTERSTSGEIYYAHLRLSQEADKQASGGSQKELATLFSLERENDVLFTRWGWLRPASPEHAVVGAWFRKVN